MHLSREFEVERSREDVVAVIERDDTLEGLLAGGRTEIVERRGDRRTTRTRYRALGREGVATFHFDLLAGGSLRFEKVCDGRVWKSLCGDVCFEEQGPERTRVQIDMRGSTKTLVPEIAIRQPMQEQLDRMVRALRERIERAAPRPGRGAGGKGAGGSEWRR